MSRLRHRFTTEEDGAVLLITLAFMTFVGLIAGALLNYANTNLVSTVKLKAARSVTYDADAAMETAIATVRIDPARGYVGACDPIAAVAANNVGSDMRVDCVPTLMPVFQRKVYLTVCPASVVTTPCPDTSSLLRAEVVFYDDGAFGREALVNTWSTNR
jgi:hypothetical protein